jgi:hypothetical protein
MTPASHLLRYVRYAYVRDALCIVAFLSFAIWILEVSGNGLVFSSGTVHGSHARGAAQQPSPVEIFEETGQEHQLHDFSPFSDDSGTSTAQE